MTVMMNMALGSASMSVRGGQYGSRKAISSIDIDMIEKSQRRPERPNGFWYLTITTDLYISSKSRVSAATMLGPRLYFRLREQFCL
jgi:hypothetical protein